MKICTLHTKQNLPNSLQEAWDFLSSPKNLQAITPDYMSMLSRLHLQILPYRINSKIRKRKEKNQHSDIL